MNPLAWVRSGRFRVAWVAGSVAAVTVSLMVVAAAASPGAGSPAAGSKADAPVNINPEKAPVYELPQVAAEPADPLEEQIAAAQELVEQAVTDLGLIVCLTPQGTLAGTLSVDQVDPTVPFTLAEKQATCTRLFPGSHP